MNYNIMIIDDMTDFDGTSIFNRICHEDGIYYKELSDGDFALTFVDENKRTVTAYTDGKAIGFAAGTVMPERKTAYVSYIGVLPEYRRHSVGTKLLRALEDKMTRTGGIEKTDIVFHNPTVLAWNIPKSDADHPCAPGVNVASDAYPFFLKAGYSEFVRQNSYYLDLCDYNAPPALDAINKSLREAGIEITLYAPPEREGLFALFDAIKNSGWRSTVLSGADRGYPVIVAKDIRTDGFICGYTGPLTVSSSGRGVFCGIGTHPDYRGRGIGKAVFCEMCRLHRENGAKFMTLYTGTNNPARKIYESAGFSVVAVWADMRKELKNK